MPRLMACPHCGRHVRHDAADCPFCSATMPAASARGRAVRRGAHLSRAAILAGATALGGVACGNGAAEADQEEQVVTEGDEENDQQVHEDVEEREEPDHEIQAMPYGAAPAPRAVV